MQSSQSVTLSLFYQSDRQRMLRVWHRSTMRIHGLISTKISNNRSAAGNWFTAALVCTYICTSLIRFFVRARFLYLFYLRSSLVRSQFSLTCLTSVLFVVNSCSFCIILIRFYLFSSRFSFLLFNKLRSSRKSLFDYFPSPPLITIHPFYHGSEKASPTICLVSSITN